MAFGDRPCDSGAAVRFQSRRQRNAAVDFDDSIRSVIPSQTSVQPRYPRYRLRAAHLDYRSPIRARPHARPASDWRATTSRMALTRSVASEPSRSVSWVHRRGHPSLVHKMIARLGGGDGHHCDRNWRPLQNCCQKFIFGFFDAIAKRVSFIGVRQRRPTDPQFIYVKFSE